MPHEPKVYRKEFVTIEFVVDNLRSLLGIEMEAVNAVDASKQQISESNLHRPGLVLAGYVELFTHQRIQLLGNTENRYLGHLEAEARQAAFRNLIQFPIPCIILTENNALDPDLVEMATEAEVPVFKTSMPTTRFMSFLGDFLSDQFAPQLPVHGSLVAVYGIGLLIMGKSGIGKSEVALDLVERGHRLVADDVVIATKRGENVLIGSGTDLVQHFMEVRGLGLVDVRAMFGIHAIRTQKRIEVVVNMQLWDPEEDYTRISMMDDTYSILDVDLPKVKVPITPGKNITVICEVIAMNHLLRHNGYDPAEVFAQRLSERIQNKEKGRPLRNKEFFEHDFE